MAFLLLQPSFVQNNDTTIALRSTSTKQLATKTYNKDQHVLVNIEFFNLTFLIYI